MTLFDGFLLRSAAPARRERRCRPFVSYGRSSLAPHSSLRSDTGLSALRAVTTGRELPLSMRAGHSLKAPPACGRRVPTVRPRRPLPEAPGSGPTVHILAVPSPRHPARGVSQGPDSLLHQPPSGSPHPCPSRCAPITLTSKRKESWSLFLGLSLTPAHVRQPAGLSQTEVCPDVTDRRH